MLTKFLRFAEGRVAQSKGLGCALKLLQPGARPGGHVCSLTLHPIQAPGGAVASLPSRNPFQSEITELKHSADRNNKHSAGSQQLCWASLFPHPSSIFSEKVFKQFKLAFQSQGALNLDTESCSCLSSALLHRWSPAELDRIEEI